MKHAAIACGLLLMSVTPGAQSAGSLLLVLNKTDATLSLVDPVSGKTTATVATGSNPHEVTTSADGRLAITTNYGGNSLSVIDLAARKEVHRVALPDLGQPHGIETVGGIVVFTAEGHQAIAGYDPATNRIAWRTPSGQNGTHMVTASLDGRTLFASNLGANTITILDRSGDGWRASHVAVGPGPEGLDLTPDGRELWTAHTGDSGVSIIDVPSRKVLHRVDAKTRRSNRLKFTRDGRHALISDLDGGELVVIDARTHGIVKRVRLGSMPEGILVPPEGDRIYVAVTGENRVAVVDAKALEVVQTITTGRGPDGMAWAAAPTRSRSE
jgi:YVTN family beta-propeller protein